jgi:DNA-binding HxlR family transcriptional regulator
MTKKQTGKSIDIDKSLPSPLINAITAVDNDVRRAIIYEIDANRTMAFTSIHKAVEISKQDLAAHLKVLVNAGILYRKARKLPTEENYSSYYCLTQFAIDLLKCMLIALDTERCKELFAAIESKTISVIDWQSSREEFLDNATKEYQARNDYVKRGNIDRDSSIYCDEEAR